MWRAIEFAAARVERERHDREAAEIIDEYRVRVEQLEGALRLVLDRVHHAYGPEGAVLTMTMGVSTAAIDAARAALGEP